MEEDTDPKNSPPPVPLNYAVPTRGSERAIKVVTAASGAALALIVVGFIDLVLFPYPFLHVPPMPPPPKTAWRYVIAFLSLAPVTLVGFLLLRRRRPWRYFQWFLVGILIGVGVAGLVEGTCYANP